MVFEVNLGGLVTDDHAGPASGLEDTIELALDPWAREWSTWD